MKLHLDVRVLKGTALALAVVLVVLVGLLCLQRWDEGRGQIAESDAAGESPTVSEDSREVTYVNGQAYALRDLETVLLLGVDKFEEETPEGYLNNQQADFLLLLVLDEAGETCTPIQLNRDTMTQIQILGVTGEPAGTFTGQLALAHTYGSGEEDSCENTADAVSMLLGGVKIDHYVGMTMGAVPLINDMVGGVTVTVLDDFSGIDDSLVEGETVTLQGEQALHYVRIRRGLEDSTNLNRMERQQQYLNALTDQIESLGDDFSPSFSELDQLSQYIVSDCSVQQLNDLTRRYAGYEMAEEMLDIKGEARQGTEFVENYPDEEALQEQVLSLFYVPKEA